MKKIMIAASLVISMFACQKNAEEDKKQETANNAENPGTTVSTTNNNSQAPKAVIKFENPVFDFGEVAEGDKVKHVYKFTNEGKNPLIIEEAKPSCGCTVPTFPKEPIAPGATAEIVAEFDSNGKPGDQNKTITITANTEPTTTQLTLKGKVKAKNPQMQDISKFKGPIKQ
ncbi:hypothetical protein AD998_05740 [bacterium 336/3]|jgi:Protein of unknown function (DUF1573)|nr:hypothetical protein AD998_05740 [bacterium 336/3]